MSTNNRIGNNFDPISYNLIKSGFSSANYDQNSINKLTLLSIAFLND